MTIEQPTPTSLELFAGAGGMALGVSQAGFKHLAVVERDGSACKTLIANNQVSHGRLGIWPIVKDDIRNFDYSGYAGRVDLLSGGPPCQPFSQGGKKRGHNDSRDMFPEAIRAVRQARPRAFLFENVRGILRPRFANYVEYLRLQLMYPNIEKNKGEQWPSHRARLEKHHTRGGAEDYRVLMRWVDAADYGVPQRRQRVIIVGVRKDLGVEWTFPEPTHSADALLREKWITGDYWDRHRVAKGKQQRPSASIKTRLKKLIGLETNQNVKPWVTVRDALKGLPNPIRINEIPNHEHVSGARSYPGHTGSHPDEPAKALKAGSHGVPGGENMIRWVNGQIRYFTLRECGRLQTFPDDYVFEGSWGAVIKQLGNAVPVTLAATIARSLREVVAGDEAFKIKMIDRKAR